MLMTRDGLNEHQAFLEIQRRARRQQRTMSEVAEGIVRKDSLDKRAG
jgi:AmiR/NasT family two-component response regulator